jgi:protein SCO1/2
MTTLSIANEPGRRQAVVAGLGIAALAASMQAPAAVTREPRAQRFPDVRLITHEGKAVRFYSDLLRNRIVLVNMSYALCNNVCPPMTQNLLRVQKALGARVGRDIHMLTLSVLPEQDTPAELAAYVKRNRIAAGWTFVTGRREDITRARVSLGFYDRDPQVDADRTQHTGMVRIGNETLDRWCMTPALLEPELIVEAVMSVDPIGRAASASTPSASFAPR